MNCWEILGLQPGAEERDIKRRYAQLVKNAARKMILQPGNNCTMLMNRLYVMTTKISGKKSSQSICPGVLFILVL